MFRPRLANTAPLTFTNSNKSVNNPRNQYFSRVIACCLTPTVQFIRYTMARKGFNFILSDYDIAYLCHTNIASWTL